MTRALVGLASAVFAIHLVDHLVAHDASGLLFAGAIALGLACIGLTAAYRWLPPAVRGTGAILFGAILLYGGTTYHLVPTLAHPASSGTTNGTGLLTTLGAVLMIAVGSSETRASGGRALRSKFLARPWVELAVPYSRVRGPRPRSRRWWSIQDTP